MDQFVSQPAPVQAYVSDNKACDPYINRKCDNQTLKRQACMFSASGDMICDETRQDGFNMILKTIDKSKNVVGYNN
jgi:hypothetical protein